MNVLTLLLRLPFLPLQQVIALGGLIQEQIEQELHDPAAARRQLEASAAALAAGEITDKQAAEADRAATARLIGPGTSGTRGPGERGT